MLSTECRLCVVYYPYEELVVKLFNNDWNNPYNIRTMDKTSMNTLSSTTHWWYSILYFDRIYTCDTNIYFSFTFPTVFFIILRPGRWHICQWIGPSLSHFIVYRLFDTLPDRHGAYWNAIQCLRTNWSDFVLKYTRHFDKIHLKSVCKMSAISFRHRYANSCV